LVIVPLLPKDICSIRPGDKSVIVILALGWTVTIIGGYALSWKWTGYPGSTLWDWLRLRLRLLPLIVPTLLIPVLLNRISGRGTQPDHEARAGAPGARPPGPDAAGLSHGIEELSRHGRVANLTGGRLALGPSLEPAAGRPASAFPPFRSFPEP
jgi:hypothetical protein